MKSYLQMTPSFSENSKAFRIFEAEIKEQGDYYGLKLNKSKCAGIIINPVYGDKIKFRDGTHVTIEEESKDSGCFMNDRGDTSKEINKRRPEAYITW